MPTVTPEIVCRPERLRPYPTDHRNGTADRQAQDPRAPPSAPPSGTCTCFRLTFATDLVAKGIPIEDVSMLLGHKSIKIAESCYSHWVKARRERLERRVRVLWT